MNFPSRPSGTHLQSSLPRDARVCILGATGWIGRTQLAMLSQHPVPNIQLVASHARDFEFLERKWKVSEWNPLALRSFSPDFVLNFAFLTREKQVLMSAKDYYEINQLLIERMTWAAQLPNVEVLISVSSGAAISNSYGSGSDVDDKYGELKRFEEKAVLELSTGNRRAIIARAWSLSGPLVTKPSDYAFSNFIMQAKTGSIHVKSGSHVYRRYVSVDDFLELAYLEVQHHNSRLLESGGQLVSMTNLAHAIAECHEGNVQVFVEEQSEADTRIYASDNSSWTMAEERNSYRALDLLEQIKYVRRYLGRQM